MLFVVTALLTFSDDINLRIELAPSSPRVRIGRPMPTVWDVQQPSPDIREGRLRFRLRNEKVELFQFTTEEVVIHETRQRLRFLLPPAFTTPTQELAVDVTWLDRRGATVDLGTQLLHVPFAVGDTAMMLVGEELEGRARPADADRRLDTLKVEHNRGVTAVKQGQTWGWTWVSVQTFVTSMPPIEFPTDPLSYAAYDAVVVTQSGFRRLRRDQLDALAGWVSAGGRLVLEPEGTVDDHHAAFLNRLCADDPRGLVWQVDEGGRLQWPVQERMLPMLVAVDCGRVVLSPRVESEESVSEELDRQRQVARWLWSLRPPVKPDGTLPSPAGPNRINVANVTRTIRTPAVRTRQVEWHDSQAPRLTFELLSVLKPAGVRLVPLWLVAALLAGLAIAIGPGEWMVLGRLRRRSWTWITWPAMTLTLTVLLIGIANAYLRSNDEPRVLAIHDLDSQGRIVRTNRFELLFKSTSGAHATTVRRGLWANQQDASQFSPQNLSMTNRRQRLISVAAQRGMTVANPSPVPPKAGPPGRFIGRLPGPYTVEQAIEQWSPRLNRLLQIPLEPSPGPIDWSTIDLDSWLSPTAQARVVPTHVVQEVRRQLGSKALVALHHASGDWAVSDDRAWWTSESAYHFARQSTLQKPGVGRATSMTRWAQLVWLFTHRAESTGTWTPWGPPLGQSNLGDVPVLEPAGAHEWAITVVVPDRGNLTVYRRMLGPRVATADLPEKPTEAPQ